jgi:hypothetical protein
MVDIAAHEPLAAIVRGPGHIVTLTRADQHGIFGQPRASATGSCGSGTLRRRRIWANWLVAA